MTEKLIGMRGIARSLFAAMLVSAAAVPATAVLAEDRPEAFIQDALREFEFDNEDRSDPVVLTFSTVGDSRQDPVNPDPTQLPLSGQDKMWLQNTKAWSRIIRSIEDQKPQFLFFNGDMIMGYGKASVPADTSTVPAIVRSDLVQFYTQYAFWRGMVADLMETGTYVVPVPGNHEVQSKALGKKAQPENETAWRANMGDLILDKDRFQNMFNEQPTNINVSNNAVFDGLTSDQTQLSYSFDFRGSHFVIVNTDPVGSDSHAPTRWLASDLANAKIHGAKHFFIFGHKPAYTYYYGANPASPLPSSPSGLDADLSARDAFWQVIEQYGATYFCGHEHIFNISRPLAGKGGSAVQVMVGSGGSPFEAKPTDATISSTDRLYAWATVKVRQSGKVKITAYGFNDQFGPTSKLQTLKLAH